MLINKKKLIKLLWWEGDIQMSRAPLSFTSALVDIIRRLTLNFG